MEKVVSLKVSSYEDKEKLVSALTNSGYYVGAVLEKDSVYRTNGWKIDIFQKKN